MFTSMKSTLLTIIFAPLFNFTLTAQVFTNKEVGRKNIALADSLKQMEYPYSLPIWGAKATKAGYNLPYSAGVSIQYFWQESDLIIDNLQVGFNNGQKYNLDGLVRFDEAKATASAATFRPDIWLFPFLNVYGIFGVAQASTEVGYGIWIPDSTNTEKKIFSTETIVEFQSATAGLGITPTIGVGGGFLALDMNFTWTDVPQLEDPAFAFVFGPRLGKNFKFAKPERSIAVWAGGFRVAIRSGTEGSINLSEVFETDGIDAKLENGNLQLEEAQMQVDEWWANLSPLEQANPVNKAKYEASNAVFDRVGQILNQAEIAVNKLEQSTVQYSMDKEPKDKWNFIVGSQFQLNKHIMIRAEAGFLSSRTQFLTGIQYRFGI